MSKGETTHLEDCTTPMFSEPLVLISVAFEINGYWRANGVLVADSVPTSEGCVFVCPPIVAFDGFAGSYSELTGKKQI